MGWRSLLLACAIAPACSFVLVNEPQETEVRNPQLPLRCTSSRASPIADVAIGALLGGLVAATTYTFVEKANEDCPVPGTCYTPWKPAVLASFLVISPWGISAAVGFSDTGRCRAAVEGRARAPQH